MWCHSLKKNRPLASSCWVICLCTKTGISKPTLLPVCNDMAMCRTSLPRSKHLQCSSSWKEWPCLSTTMWPCPGATKRGAASAGYGLPFWWKPSQLPDLHAFGIPNWAAVLLKCVCFSRTWRSDQKHIWTLIPLMSQGRNECPQRVPQS